MVVNALATFLVVWAIFKYGAVFRWLEDVVPMLFTPRAALRALWLHATHPAILGITMRAACVIGSVVGVLVPARHTRPATTVVAFIGAAAAAGFPHSALPASAVCLVITGALLVDDGHGVGGQILAAIGIAVLITCTASAWRLTAEPARTKRKL